MIERFIFERRPYQRQCLVAMRAVPRIDQRRAVLARKQDVVGREPTALKDGEA